jgi:hypothetical protein
MSLDTDAGASPDGGAPGDVSDLMPAPCEDYFRVVLVGINAVRAFACLLDLA